MQSTCRYIIGVQFFWRSIYKISIVLSLCGSIIAHFELKPRQLFWNGGSSLYLIHMEQQKLMLHTNIYKRGQTELAERWRNFRQGAWQNQDQILRNKGWLPYRWFGNTLRGFSSNLRLYHISSTKEVILGIDEVQPSHHKCNAASH